MAINHAMLPETSNTSGLNVGWVLQHQYRTVLDTFAIYSETDPRGTIIFANSLLCELSGYSLSELLGSNHNILQSHVHPSEFFTEMWRTLAKKEIWHGEICNRAKDGSLYWESATMIPILSANNSSIEKFVSIRFDITEKKSLEHKIEHISKIDLLTGLPNRQEFIQQFHARTWKTGCSVQQFAVAVVDIDDFKSINDSHGRPLGDELLVQVADRIRAVLQPTDVLARLGGDEFLLLIDHMEKGLESYCDQFIELFQKPFLIEGVQISISASMGVTRYPIGSTDNVEQALRHADMALYHAKGENKNCYRIFDTSEDSKVKQAFQLRKELLAGFINEEFEAYFQPIINLASSATVGFESLIRWQHPIRGLLSPIEFLPAIEDDDLIVRVGEWMLSEAMQFSQTLYDRGLPHTVTVNIAALHLQHSEFVAHLASTLERHPDLPQGSLVIEITETAALTNIQSAIAVVLRCKTLGVTFALDDFGTGFSSLTYLRRLPVDTLKIDREFIRDILVDPEDLAIVRLVGQLSEIYNLNVVAEGIESDEQSALLVELSCEYGQGYGIAKPMPCLLALAWASSRAAASRAQFV